jgi:type IV secretion system protein TrbL
MAVADPVLASIRFAGPEIKLNELWSVLLTSAAIAYLAGHAPGVAAALLAGSPSLTAATVSQSLTSSAPMVAGVAGGMVAATRAAAHGASALGGRGPEPPAGGGASPPRGVKSRL